MASRSRACKECQGTMIQIVLMDKSHLGAITPFEYRLSGDKPNFWTGRHPSARPVESWMCDDCGRIQLYGTLR
jgi:hypothetical protein